MSISSTINESDIALELAVAPPPSAPSDALSEEMGVDGSLSHLTDAAKFSAVAPRLHEALRHMSTPENNVVEALSNNVSKLQDGFVNTLYSVLTAASVDLTCKITLRMNNNGLLVLHGEHPQKEQIENIFTHTPELSAAFLEIASQSAALRDIRSLHTMVMNIAGVDHYTRLQAPPADIAYQVSIKGDMNHFYFSNPRYVA